MYGYRIICDSLLFINFLHPYKALNSYPLEIVFPWDINQVEIYAAAPVWSFPIFWLNSPDKTQHFDALNVSPV